MNLRTTRRVAPVWLALVQGVALCACAHAPEAHRVRYAELGSVKAGNWDGQGALVVEFQAGDRIPVDFEFSAEDFELAPAKPSLELLAKQHCFVRFSKEGVRTSLDGTDFDRKPRQPGSFRFGLVARPGEQPHLDVALSTPRR
jgi:hypothetical protein